MGRLTGRVAIVTCAASGIGLATSKRFAAGGAAAVLYFASGDSAFVAGTELIVDGGFAQG